jgi:hypothetical protein
MVSQYVISYHDIAREITYKVSLINYMINSTIVNTIWHSYLN